MRAALVAVLVLLLAGCGNSMSVDDIEQFAEAQQACNEAGGVFDQWQSGLDGSEQWRCDFDQREDDR